MAHSLKAGRPESLEAFALSSLPASQPIRLLFNTETHLKNRILVQDRGGAEFQTGGILLYVEDLKRGTNKNIGPKDIFEMGSRRLVLYSLDQKHSDR
jgi:hypothetical protein